MLTHRNIEERLRVQTSGLVSTNYPQCNNHKAHRGVISIRQPSTTYRGKDSFPHTIGKNHFINIFADITQADVHLLIGLQDLKHNGLLLDYAHDIIIDLPTQITNPVRDKGGHNFWEWNITNIFFTRNELLQLHLNLLHP